MSSRVLIFDHFLKPVAEINATTTPRSWILDGIGRAEFSLSTSDPKCTESNLQFGNMVYVTHVASKDETSTKNGTLPSWVGMILPPRRWDYGVCHVTAYSAEVLFSYRAMPQLKIRGTARNMLRQILEYAMQAANNIPVQPGVMDDTDLVFDMDLRLSAYDHISTLARDAGMNWDVTGDIDARGNLSLFLNLYRQKGVLTSLELNNINSELNSPLLSEEGAPMNEVFGYSQANTPQSRVKGNATHQDSKNDYGPLQANVVFFGHRDQTSVLASAKALADERGRPKKIVRRVALDESDTFSHLNTGNRVVIHETAAGFSHGGAFGFRAAGKIVSMEYNDLSNKVPVNMEITQ